MRGLFTLIAQATGDLPLPAEEPQSPRVAIVDPPGPADTAPRDFFAQSAPATPAEPPRPDRLQ